MTERVDDLQKLGEVVRAGKPVEVDYALGDGEEKTELIVTYLDGCRRISSRVASSPRIRLHKYRGRTLMDLKTEECSYEGLRPNGVEFEPPIYSQGDLGTLVVDLNRRGTRRLTLAQCARAE